MIGTKRLCAISIVIYALAVAPCPARTSASEVEMKANEANNLGRYAQALEFANEGLKLDSKSPYLYYERSVSYQMLRRLEPALKDAESALKLNPRDDRLYQRKGDVLQDMGRIDDAIFEYTRSLKIGIGTGAVLKKRAHCYYLLGKTDLAQKDLQAFKDARKKIGANTTSVRLARKKEPAILAAALSPQGRKAFSDLLKKSPESADSLYSSIALATLQINRNQMNRRAYLLRAYRLEQLEDFQGSYRDLTRVLEIDPRGPGVTQTNTSMDEVLFTHARIGRKLGKVEEAIADYTKILKMEPDCEEAYRYRGDCHAEKGNLQAAIQDYSRAIEFDRESPGSTYFARAQIFRKLGKTKEADSDLALSKKLGYVDKQPQK